MKGVEGIGEAERWRENGCHICRVIKQGLLTRCPKGIYIYIYIYRGLWTDIPRRMRDQRRIHPEMESASTPVFDMPLAQESNNPNKGNKMQGAESH